MQRRLQRAHSQPSLAAVDAARLLRDRPLDEALLLSAGVHRGWAKTLVRLVLADHLTHEADRLLWARLRALVLGGRPHAAEDLRASLRFRQAWASEVLEDLHTLADMFAAAWLGPLGPSTEERLLRRTARNLRWFRTRPGEAPAWYLEPPYRSPLPGVVEERERLRFLGRCFAAETVRAAFRGRAVLLEVEALARELGVVP